MSIKESIISNKINSIFPMDCESRPRTNMITNVVIFLGIAVLSRAQDCNPSITTASGDYAPQKICSGQLIFDENFDKLDKKLWQPESTFNGGYNGEFEWYTPDDENSFVSGGNLHIKPTLTARKIGEYNVTHGSVKLTDCTDSDPDFCHREAKGDVIINPIRSARLITRNSFRFKYGRVEFVAKNPSGDWLWPALWLLAVEDKYDGWSGEIDVMESRGNRKYVTQFESTLHYGQLANENHESNSKEINNAEGFDSAFHKYGLIWNDEGITFQLDDATILSVPVEDGFWRRGGFKGENHWAKGSKMAPFDIEFYLLINLAVGSTNGFFPDDDAGETGKPWKDDSPAAMKEFWLNREQWLPSWANQEKSSFLVESVKIWAI